MYFILVDSEGFIINIIVLTEGANYTPPGGVTLYPLPEGAKIGDKYIDGLLIPIDPPTPPPVNDNTVPGRVAALEASFAAMGEDMGDVTTLLATLSQVAFSGDYTDLHSKPTRSFIDGVTRALVSSPTATGFQAHATRDAYAVYSLLIATTATIGGAARGDLVLEICPTNSQIAADWVMIDKDTNGQTVSLALAVQSVLTQGAKLCGVIPAGYFARIRSIPVSGSPTFTYVVGREILL